MWVPPENIDPVILHAPTRKSVAFFGAVRPSDGLLVTQQVDKFNAQTFQAFLVRLIRRKRQGRKMVVVVDNARWHHAKALQPWLRQHHKSLRLDFLPPYSPELNHIERVWKLTRRLCIHNCYFELLEKLIDTVVEQFQTWAKPNKTLRRLCAII
jgi:transposase